MNEIKITINEEYKYKKLRCEKGHIVANIKNGIDLENYVGGNVVYISINDDENQFVCITEDEHNEIIAQIPIPQVDDDEFIDTGDTTTNEEYEL